MCLILNKQALISKTRNVQTFLRKTGEIKHYAVRNITLLGMFVKLYKISHYELHKFTFNLKIVLNNSETISLEGQILKSMILNFGKVVVEHFVFMVFLRTKNQPLKQLLSPAKMKSEIYEIILIRTNA